jgi:mRNA interferase RelE/StbE
VNGERYEVRFQPAARRAIAERLPESVATAVLEFCDAALALSPRRVGKPLFGPLAGCLGARRGTYRVVYRIDEQAHVVEVLDIDHRADIYHRPLTAPRSVDEVIGRLPCLARRQNASKHVGAGLRADGTVVSAGNNANCQYDVRSWSGIQVP